MEKYDSTADTTAHIAKIRHFMDLVLFNLVERANNHDKSKLEAPEKAIFDEYTPKLKGSTYGSGEYMLFLNEMKAALKHH